MLLFKRIAGQMIIPCGMIVISVILIWKWPFLLGKIDSAEKIKALVNIMPGIPYAIFPLGILMGWRYNNTGLILTSFLISLTYASMSHFPAGDDSTVNAAVSFLFPLNLACFSLISKKRLLSVAGLFLMGLIGLQAAFIICFCMPLQSSMGKPAALMCTYLPVTPETMSAFMQSTTEFLNGQWFPLKILPTPSVFTFFITMIFLLIRVFITRDMVTAGYLGALVAVFLGLTSTNTIPDTPLFFMAAGLIPIFTNIEASFFQAYVDELTGLPGRRSLNDTMANLNRKYTIAMMDIDYFKKFNDTYGHKTGDDVLKMVAMKLEKLSGGAKTFRYGGEEFTAVFPGKTLDQALPHLESLRYDIENSPFTVRSKSRKKNSKNDRGRGGGKKQVRVTISIGAAGPDKRQPTPEKVIKSADKALYKAKKAGRNCVRAL